MSIPRRNFVTEWTSFINLIQVCAVPGPGTRLYIYIIYIYIHLYIQYFYTYTPTHFSAMSIFEAGADRSYARNVALWEALPRGHAEVRLGESLAPWHKGSGSLENMGLMWDNMG